MCVVMLFLVPSTTHAQLGTLKRRLEKKIVDKMLGEDESDTNAPAESSENTSTTKGKKLTPPSVTDNLSNALTALEASQYANARYDIKEATRGVELEIGYQILEAMPTQVSGLAYEADEDGVVSTGIGFVGLVISRTYQKGSRQITATVGNNSALGAYGMMLSGNYATNDDNQKSVTVQGNRGTLFFDGGNEYRLGIPFAQSSAFVLECDGFGDEAEVMAAMEAFQLSTFEALLMDKTSNATANQDANRYLKTAQTEYNGKKLDNTRVALQQALAEVDKIIGQQILEMLPAALGDLQAVTTQDSHTSAGFTGIYIQRIYESADKSERIEVNLMNDSPLLAGVTTFLASPLIAVAAGNKVIKVDGYKGMYEKEEGSDPLAINISIPSNQTLLTLNFTKVSETNANTYAQQIPVGDIFALIK